MSERDDDADVPLEPAAPQSAVADARAFQLRGDPPRVMRLSRKALAVVGGVAALGIAGSLIYALAPADEKPAQELYNTESRSTSEAITSGPQDYANVPKLGPPLPGDLGGPIVSAQQRGKLCRCRRLVRSPVSPIRTRRPPKQRGSAPSKKGTLQG